MLTQFSNLQQFYRGKTYALFRGRTIADGLPVIIKAPNGDTIKPAEVAALQNEHRMLRACAGPGVPKAVSLVPFGAKIALVLEDSGPKTLAEVLLTRKIDLSAFLRYAICIAEVVVHIHNCGVIHRDLSPSNIVLGSNDRLTIVDFEFAAGTSSASHRSGSPSSLVYSSPEQTGRMEHPLDHRSDLYSVGVIFYHMLVGQVPFPFSDPLELVHAHLSCLPVSPRELNPEVPAVLSDMVLRLMAKAPEDRYHSAYGILQDLLEIQRQFQTDGAVHDFITGMHDRPRGLTIPERLYGRSDEARRLTEAFQRVAQNGVPELTLISGASGVGKTALVREFSRTLTKERGLLTSGKFDQHMRDVPFHTIAQAFREAVRYVLTESAERISDWRVQIQSALGLSGQLIVGLIPELEHLIGKQPAVPALSPTDEQKRFDSIFRKFVEVFARREHPLIIFLDDLQWADAASLRVIKNLVCDPGPLHLMLIGAYRDNEVEEGRPLSRIIAELQRQPVAVEQIFLAPLSIKHVSSLVCDALGCGPDAASDLVRMVFAKTRGNPFFTEQFLKSLYQEKLLTYNQAIGAWECDLLGVDKIGYSDNVVDLLVDKLKRLPASTCEMLIRLACLGNRVDFQTLCTVVDSPETLESDVSRAVEDGLIVRLGDSLKFLHDRVQQAAYSLILEDARAAKHLCIGRMMLLDKDQVENRIFDIVNQLNQGAALLSDSVEREQLAALNLSAGRKGRASTAYGAAFKFYSMGISLLDKTCWKKNYQLAYDLHFDRAECEWLLGNYDDANSQFEQLLTRSRTKFNKANIYRMQVELYTGKVELANAVDRGLKGLKLLGIDMSPHPSREEVQTEYNNIWSKLGDRQIEDLVNLPVMTSPEMSTAMDILVALFAATLCSDQNLFLLAACHMVNISLRYGHCSASAMGYGFLGMGLGTVFGKYAEGYRFGKLGYDLVELHGLSAYKAKINFIFGDTINYYQRHLRTDMDYLDVAFKSAVEVGDILIACYCCNHICANLIALGEPLDAVYRETERRLEFTQRMNFDSSYQALFAMQKFVRNMRGETDSITTFSHENFDDATYDQMMSSYGQPIVTCWYYILKLQARVMFGLYEEAVEVAAKAEPLLWTSMAHVQEHEYWFFCALALTGSFGSLPESKRAHCLQEIERHMERLSILADSCPQNFYHKFALVSAEKARIEGDRVKSSEMYEKAIKSARENGYVQNEGLANELAAKSYIEWGLETASVGYLEAARFCYTRWGADAKVDQLECSYPALRTRTSTSDSWDVMAVFKAARAISSEVVLDRLLETLMRVVVTASGAQRGVLVLEDSGELIVRAHGPATDCEHGASGEQAGKISIVDIPMQSYSGAPHSVLNYVSRAKESVLLSNAAREGVFGSDPYIREHGTRSVLCIPIVKQERLIGVLYLENNLAASLFTNSRLELMQLLSSQIVTALENGTLFEAMRKEVAERKRAEEMLRLNEQHLRLAFDLAAVGMVQIDLKTHKFVRVNARYCEIVGYTSEELMHMTVEEVTHPSHRSSDAEQWMALQQGLVPEISLEKQYVRKDRKLVPVQVNAALIRYPDGQPWVTIAVVHEVSRRRRNSGDDVKKLLTPGKKAQT
jgi:PAS domain S-box-containing protein